MIQYRTTCELGDEANTKIVVVHSSIHTPVTLSSCPSCIATSWMSFGCRAKTGSCPPTDIPPYLDTTEKISLLGLTVLWQGNIWLKFEITFVHSPNICSSDWKEMRSFS